MTCHGNALNKCNFIIIIIGIIIMIIFIIIIIIIIIVIKMRWLILEIFDSHFHSNAD